jgi:hypothetical protein
MTVAEEVSLAAGVDGICDELEALQSAWEGALFTGTGLPPDVWLGTIVVAGVEAVGGVGEACEEIDPPAGMLAESNLAESSRYVSGGPIAFAEVAGVVLPPEGTVVAGLAAGFDGAA